MLLRFSCLIIFLLVMSGCSSAPNVMTKVRDSVYLATISSYAIVPYREERPGVGTLSDGNRNQIEFAIEAAMDSHGMVLSDDKQASVWVNYFVVGSHLSYLFDYNRTIRACYDCKTLSYRSSQKHEIGTLILDLVDPKTGISVWRGIAPKIFVKTKSEFDNLERAEEAIARLIKHFFAVDRAKDSNSAA